MDGILLSWAEFPQLPHHSQKQDPGHRCALVDLSGDPKEQEGGIGAVEAERRQRQRREALVHLPVGPMALRPSRSRRKYVIHRLPAPVVQGVPSAHCPALGSHDGRVPSRLLAP